MKIRLIGQRNQTGIGTHYANFADAVLATEWANCVEELDHTDREGLVAGYERSEPDDINIVFVCMPLQRAYRGTTIQWIVFESTRVFPTILDIIQDAHQVWVPSAWGRDVLIQHGLDPARCWVVHEGVDPQRYTTIATHKSDTLNYLFNGKCEIRKSIVETVQAWQQEFGNDPGVKLILKTGHYTDQEYSATRGAAGGRSACRAGFSLAPDLPPGPTGGRPDQLRLVLAAQAQHRLWPGGLGLCCG